jgi:predicted acylesterase/phospholipase RssA
MTSKSWTRAAPLASLPWLLVLGIALGALSGCGGGAKRAPHEKAYLLERRDAADKQVVEDIRGIVNKVLTRTKAEYDDYAAGRRPDPPVVDILIISGGGDWGAFGAGYLKGWKSRPATDPLAMPEFDVVTGVSTGALIAPFAFLSTDESIQRIEHLYRNPKKDWVKQRWPLYFLPNNISFAEVPGLERELRQQVTPEMIRAIAERGRDGRLCAVNTTNLDDASPRVFDLVAEAQRASDTGDMSRMYNIMLASSGIPGAFPYREIDGDMYVDGGVTSNIIYGGRMSEEDTLTAAWARQYPDVPIPKTRFWVIFNNQLRTLPTTVAPRWPAIVTRSLELATRSATVTAMRHLHAMAEISRLKRKADVEVRIVAIPGDWTAPVEGVFKKETMNDLADLGERMGADPRSWHTEPP